MPLKFTQIHHVAIIVSNLASAKHFYVDILGLPIIREHYRPKKNDTKLDLQLDNCQLEIFAATHPPKRPSFPEACGLRHLAFKTTNIEAEVAYLKEQGVRCEEIRRDTFTNEKMTFFFDPDGLPLELHE